MQKPVDSLKINYNGKERSVTGSFNSVEFENEGYTIIYIPSLRLSAYGKNLEEAHEMMGGVVLQDFAETLVQYSVDRVIKEMKDLGFKQSPFFKSVLSNYFHMDKEGILREFDLSEDIIMQERLVTHQSGYLAESSMSNDQVN